METAPSDESWAWDWLLLTCPFLDLELGTALVPTTCPMAHAASSLTALFVTQWGVPKFLGKDQEDTSPLLSSVLFQLEPVHRDTQTETKAAKEKDSISAGFSSLEGWKEIYTITMVIIMSVLKTNNFYMTFYQIHLESSFDTNLLAISSKDHHSECDWTYILGFSL